MSGQTLEITPALDLQVLIQKAQESAMKGAIEAINNYYTGYNSPFIKSVTEILEAQRPSIHMELPDIISILNASLTKRIDEIANTAVAQTFVPIVNKMLTRAEKDVKFSDILSAFVKIFQYEDKDQYDFEISIKEDARWGWLTISLSCGERSYSFTLHKDSLKDGQSQTYSLCGLPRETGTNNHDRKMKLSVDNATLELPFTPDVLGDDFVSFCARLVLSDSNIHMDTKEFQDWMFPERCHCH